MLLGIDQGTTGTSVIAFDDDLAPVASSYRKVASVHPRPGWVEQDPEALVATVVEAVAEVLAKLGGPRHVKAVGLDNQGESVVAWDARTGAAITPVLVWSDRRASDTVHGLRQAGHGPRVRELTGLELSDYFGAAKVHWLLRNDPAVRAALEAGRLRIGTLDAWLAHRLGHRHDTDLSTASRTQLVGLRSGSWEPELLELFGVPVEVLPPIKAALGDWGTLHHRSWGGELPWYASLVDQPASLAGNGCLDPGQAKVTYGTGCFAYVQAGSEAPKPGEHLLASVAWSVDEERTFALDGGVFTAGAAIEWLLRLGVLETPAQSSELALSASTSGVRFLPAFTGLGAPWWDGEARGVFAGLTAGVGRAEMVRAVLEGIGYRVRDVVGAIRQHVEPRSLRVDGGLTKNPYLMQFQSNVLGTPLEVSAQTEATARGAAMLAGFAAGLLSQEQGRSVFKAERVYEPQWGEDERESKYAEWLAFLHEARRL